MSNETIAWKICYTDKGQYRTALSEHNSVGDYRAIDPMASSIALCAAPVSAEPVAFVESIDPVALQATIRWPWVQNGVLPQWLNVGVSLYASPVAAQAHSEIEITDGMALVFHNAIADGSIGQQEVDEIKTGLRAVFANIDDSRPLADTSLTQQTLDDVKAGIPARDAEIEALRKELETLQRAQAQPTFDDLQALAIKHGAWVPGYGPFAAELLATYGLAPEKQPHWVTGWLNAMNAVNAKAAQQPVSGADGFPEVMQPIETIEYWADAYSNPEGDEHFMGHGMVVTLLREYAALRAALAQQDADKVDADRYRAWRDAAVANSTQFVIAMRKALPPEAWTGTPRWPTTTEWDAAIDAARKEQA
ncbi:hypothetical protein NIZ92_11690 [Alcaligenes sp. 1735tsa3]|uniref:hypothetical protein n=1 Tax=Alcaligenes sp. 1735tsa3 TaxID=2953809 RepID=UPI0020A7E26E|nr:hypothetical protein [Alcaligenes sp. 1735tsa3]USY23984.1 hypothetical protein NIZ92_11690 [Alcaligenes sp. 1735tsa3]